jgi:hypothetical protein
MAKENMTRTFLITLLPFHALERIIAMHKGLFFRTRTQHLLPMAGTAAIGRGSNVLIGC